MKSKHQLRQMKSQIQELQLTLISEMNMNANKTVPIYEIKILIKIDEITKIEKHVNIELGFKFMYSIFLYKS